MVEMRKGVREIVFGVEAIAQVNSAPKRSFVVEIANYCANGVAFTLKSEAPNIKKGDYVTLLFNKDEPEQMHCLCEIVHVDGIYYGCRREATQIKKPVES